MRKVDKTDKSGYYIIIMKEYGLFTDEINISGGLAVAIGNFDGVHIAHKALIKALVDTARDRGVPSAVFTFESDDNPKKDASRLMTDEKRFSLLSSLGVDLLIKVPFGKIKNISAEKFVSEILLKKLKAKVIVCGYDFRFGKGGKGNTDTLKAMMPDVSVIALDCVREDNEAVSSTRIRNLLQSGDIAGANRLLGHKFSIDGEIVRGARIGHTIGVPTINVIYPEKLALTPFGVYISLTKVDGKIYKAITDIGKKPTVGSDRIIAEAHLLADCGELYGKFAEISLISFVRKEEKFESLEALKLQLQKDISSAEKYFAENGENYDA